MNNILADNKLDIAIQEIIKQAGAILLSACLSASAIHEKEGMANFCTDYDLQIQRFLMDRLSVIVPNCNFYGEEDTEGNREHTQSPYTFFIDPIDGTTNFMFSYHHSCVSVGLAFERRIVAGYVYNPYVDEMYHAVRGHGAWLNDRKLNVKDTVVAQGIVAFGCARYNDADTDLLFDVTKEMFLRSLSVRNGGSAALDLCRIASGNNVAYYELKLQPYDYAAASVIIEEAGGYISCVDGSQITLDVPCSIVGGTKSAWQEVREVILQAGFIEK